MPRRILKDKDYARWWNYVIFILYTIFFQYLKFSKYHSYNQEKNFFWKTKTHKGYDN